MRCFTTLLVVVCGLWLGCSQPTPPQHLVLFEFFGRPACSICKTAGPIANELLHQYEAAGKLVLMLGADVGPFGDPSPDLGGRRARWRQVFGDKMALLPLLLLQSGNAVTQGNHKDFRETYSSMINDAASTPPTAQVKASYQRTAGLFSVEVSVTNTDTAVLDPSQGASVRVFFYDDQKTMYLDHTTRAIETIALPVALLPNKSISLKKQFTLPDAIDAASLHVAVIMEHQDAQGRWQLAQGALATETSPSALEELLALIW
jgi:hypothetical protein